MPFRRVVTLQSERVRELFGEPGPESRFLVTGLACQCDTCVDRLMTQLSMIDEFQWTPGEEPQTGVEPVTHRFRGGCPTVGPLELGG